MPPCAADPPTPSPLDDQAASLESLIFVTRSSSSRWTVDQSLCDLCVVTNIGTFTIPFKLKLKLPNGPAGHHPLHHSEDAVQPLAVAYATIRTGAEDAGAHDSGGHNHRHGVRGIGSTVIFLTQPPAQQPFIDITPMDPASFHRIKLATSSLSVELSRGQQHVHLTARGAYLLRIHTTHPAVLIRQVYTTRDGQRTKNIISSPYNQGAGGGVPVFIDGDDAAPPSSSSHLSSSPILGSPQQGLYKTELCMSWTSSSMCRYGVKCKFAHGEHELVTGQRRRKYREKCIRFTQDGHCRHADRCLFMHEGEDATEGGLSRAGQGPPTAVSPSAEAARSSSDEKGEASEPAQPLVPLQRSLLDGDAARKDASASASAPAFAHVPSFRPSTIRGAESVSREVESLLSMLHPQRLPGTGLAASDAVSDEQRVGQLSDMEQHAVRAALSHLSYDSPLYLLLRELLPSTFPLSGYRSSFIIPDGVVAVGHMQTVHPALLTVTVRNRNGELHLHASPIKLLSLGGFDALPNERGKYDLLLERVASTVAPDNYSAVLPLIADGGNTKHDFSFTPVVGERYERTAAYGEMKNHVGLLTPRWKGSMERRQNKTDGDLRFLHRTDRGPLPQLVSGADMEALECQSELRVVIRSAQRPLQAVRPSVEPLAPPDPGRGQLCRLFLFVQQEEAEGDSE